MSNGSQVKISLSMHRGGSGGGVGQRQLLLMCFYTYYKVHWLIVWPGPSKKVTERVEQIGRRARGSAKGGGGSGKKSGGRVWDLGRGSSSCDRLDCSHFHLVYLTQTNRAPKLVSFSLSLFLSLPHCRSLSVTHSISLARYTTVERRPAKRTKQLSQLTNQLMLFTLFPLPISLSFLFLYSFSSPPPSLLNVATKSENSQAWQWTMFIRSQTDNQENCKLHC